MKRKTKLLVLFFIAVIQWANFATYFNAHISIVYIAVFVQATALVAYVQLTFNSKK